MGFMLMHQGIGLDAFNAMPLRRTVHAVYECCYSVPMAADLARGRPYRDQTALFRHADALLFGLSEDSLDSMRQAYPDVGRRPGSEKSHAEQCAVTDDRPEVCGQLRAAAKRYVLTAMSERLQNDCETERKVVRNELARINRSRLERMLGPEGGSHNW
jgi:2-oxo-4-hydroxy-4-carboxy-5-ureidoimidazoline decarboxylase